MTACGYFVAPRSACAFLSPQDGSTTCITHACNFLAWAEIGAGEANATRYDTCGRPFSLMRVHVKVGFGDEHACEERHPPPDRHLYPLPCPKDGKRSTWGAARQHDRARCASSPYKTKARPGGGGAKEAKQTLIRALSLGTFVQSTTQTPSSSIFEVAFSVQNTGPVHIDVSSVAPQGWAEQTTAERRKYMSRSRGHRGLVVQLVRSHIEIETTLLHPPLGGGALPSVAPTHLSERRLHVY